MTSANLANATSVVEGVTKLVLATGLAVVLGGVTTVLVVLVWRRGVRRLRVSAGKGGAVLELDAVELARKVDEVATKLDAVQQDTTAINRAVNHVPVGAPTLIARVARLEDRHEWLVDAICTIASRIGIDVPAPPPPATPPPAEQEPTS